MTTNMTNKTTKIEAKLENEDSPAPIRVYSKDVELVLTISTALNKKVFDSAKKNNATFSAEIANRLHSSFLLDETTMESCVSSLTTLIVRNELNPQKEDSVTETSLRLNRLLNDYRQLKKDNYVSAAEIAHLAGFEHRSDVESWFSGQTEPPFADLGKIAKFFYCNPTWLLFGKGVPYPLFELRYGCGTPSNLIASLIHIKSSIQAFYASGLIFVASKGINGDLMVVKVLANGNSESYKLPMSVADRITSSKYEDLPVLVLALEAIHNSDFDSRSQGVIVEESDFNLLLAGETPALLVLDSYLKKTTHDWTKRIFIYDDNLKRESVHYWHGFEDIVKCTNTAIDAIHKEQRALIKNGRLDAIGKLNELCLWIRGR